MSKASENRSEPPPPQRLVVHDPRLNKTPVALRKSGKQGLLSDQHTFYIEASLRFHRQVFHTRPPVATVLLQIDLSARKCLRPIQRGICVFSVYKIPPKNFLNKKQYSADFSSNPLQLTFPTHRTSKMFRVDPPKLHECLPSPRTLTNRPDLVNMNVLLHTFPTITE